MRGRKMLNFRRVARLTAAAAAGMAVAMTSACGNGADDGSDPVTDGNGDSAATEADADSGATYKIALLNSSGGAFAAGNQGAVDGAQFAVERINAEGGINGHEIELITGDLQGEPGNAATMIPRLADQNVIAIVGPAASGEVEAGYTLANGIGIPGISPGAARPGVVESARPYGWTMAQPDTETTTPVLTQVIADGGYERGAIIGDRVNPATAQQLPLLTQLFEDTGVELVANQEFSSGDSSFASQVTAIGASNPDVIALAAGPEDAGRIAREIRSQGLDIQLIGTAGLQSGGPSYVAAGGEDTEGTIAAAQYDADNEDEPAAGLLQEARDEKGFDEVGLNFAYGFDAIGMIAQIIEEKGISPDADPAEARDAINEGIQSLEGYEGMAGVTSFREDGTGNRPSLLSVVREGHFVVEGEVSGD